MRLLLITLLAAISYAQTGAKWISLGRGGCATEEESYPPSIRRLHNVSDVSECTEVCLQYSNCGFIDYCDGRYCDGNCTVFASTIPIDRANGYSGVPEHPMWDSWCYQLIQIPSHVTNCGNGWYSKVASPDVNAAEICASEGYNAIDMYGENSGNLCSESNDRNGDCCWECGDGCGTTVDFHCTHVECSTREDCGQKGYCKDNKCVGWCLTRGTIIDGVTDYSIENSACMMCEQGGEMQHCARCAPGYSLTLNDWRILICEQDEDTTTSIAEDVSTTAVVDVSCGEDLHVNCPLWASQHGYCNPSSQYHDYMIENCALSCGECQEITISSTPTLVPTEDPTAELITESTNLSTTAVVDVSCGEDLYDNCSIWAFHHGYCNPSSQYHDYMIENCALSCCESQEITISSTTTLVTTEDPTTSCPNECNTCQSGGSDDGGVAVVDGTCNAWCSRYGYCGASAAYQSGGTDCSGCVDIVRIPTFVPTAHPTKVPTISPSFIPTLNPTTNPSNFPSTVPTTGPTLTPTLTPTIEPTMNPSNHPTIEPSTQNPSKFPSIHPTTVPTMVPTINPSTTSPSENPSTSEPTTVPTLTPTTESTTMNPSKHPTIRPSTQNPSKFPSIYPTTVPTIIPTIDPSTTSPSEDPSTSETTTVPTLIPTTELTRDPSTSPTIHPSTERPTSHPVTTRPSAAPSITSVDMLTPFKGESTDNLHTILLLVIMIILALIFLTCVACLTYFACIRPQEKGLESRRWDQIFSIASRQVTDNGIPQKMKTIDWLGKLSPEGLEEPKILKADSPEYQDLMMHTIWLSDSKALSPQDPSIGSYGLYRDTLDLSSDGAETTLETAAQASAPPMNSSMLGEPCR